MQVTFKNNLSTLYLVSTPIGNLLDISFRAVEILKDVEVIFAEDTRVSKTLLEKYNINTKLISYHEHEKHDKAKLVIEYLEKGFDCALISDAGTPLLSDPGDILVNEVLNNNFNVTSIPGASASLSALVSSNLLVNKHLFLGFLPRKKNEKINELLKYKTFDGTIIIYESPFRVKDTLNILNQTYGNRKVTIARELTKMYETFIRTTLDKAVLMEHIIKGEYVILVEGYKEEYKDISIKDLYKKYIDEGYREKIVFDKVSKELNISKRDVYKEIKIDNK